MYDLLIQGKHTKAELDTLIALFFCVDPNNIGSILDEQKHNFHVDIYNSRGDFDIHLQIRERAPGFPEVKTVDFAIFLSNKLQKDILMTFWENNPYSWILISPGGGLHKVHEIPNEEESEKSDEFFLELDKTFQEELDIKEVREKLPN